MGAWWSTRDGKLFLETLQFAQTPLVGHGRHPPLLRCAALLVGQETDENDLEWMAAIHGDLAWQP